MGQRFPLFPAIALPVVRKSRFECPAEHIQVLTQNLPEVTKIITIGWRANETHFLELLHQHTGTRPRVMVVAGNCDEAQQICLKLHENGIGKDYEQGNNGFTGAIVNEEIAIFLSKT